MGPQLIAEFGWSKAHLALLTSFSISGIIAAPSFRISTKARGLALAIAAAGPSVLAVVGGPLLNDFLQDHGWRNGYLAVSLFTFIAGGTALIIMPPPRPGGEHPASTSARANFAGPAARTSCGHRTTRIRRPRSRIRTR